MDIIKNMVLNWIIPLEGILTTFKQCSIAILVFKRCKKAKILIYFGTHCTIHCQALLMKSALHKSNNVFSEIIRATNFIKAIELNFLLFFGITQRKWFQIWNTLVHSHVRWLSKEKVLKKIFKLRKEMQEFFERCQSRHAC